MIVDISQLKGNKKYEEIKKNYAVAILIPFWKVRLRITEWEKKKVVSR